MYNNVSPDEKSDQQMEKEGPDVFPVRYEGGAMNCCRFGGGEDCITVIPGVSVLPLSGSGEALASLFEDFLGDYTFYVFDIRSNITKGFSVEEMAEEIFCALRSLGVEKTNVYGISHGGMIGQALAAMHPETVEKLLLGSTAARTENGTKELFEKWISLAETRQRRELAETVCRDICSEKTAMACIDGMAKLSEKYSDAYLDRFAATVYSMLGFDMTDSLGKIGCETVVVGSEGDRIFGPEASRILAEGIGCELFLYKSEYGHAVYDEAPDYREKFRNFLKTGIF